MSYRERRLAKAERLREWAEKREAKAQASFDKADSIAGMIPMGQPILVGHHSEGRHRRDVERIDSGMRSGIEHSSKADDFRRRAESIERAAERSIYSDDDDATERLAARVEALQHQLDMMKAANAAARKGLPTAEWGLTPEGETEAVRNFKFWPGGTDIPFPNVKNVSATLTRNRKRLEAMS